LSMRRLCSSSAMLRKLTEKLMMPRLMCNCLLCRDKFPASPSSLKAASELKSDDTLWTPHPEVSIRCLPPFSAH
jgi:hypothetical protein